MSFAKKSTNKTVAFCLDFNEHGKNKSSWHHAKFSQNLLDTIVASQNIILKSKFFIFPVLKPFKLWPRNDSLKQFHLWKKQCVKWTQMQWKFYAEMFDQWKNAMQLSKNDTHFNPESSFLFSHIVKAGHFQIFQQKLNKQNNTWMITLDATRHTPLQWNVDFVDIKIQEAKWTDF